MLERRVVESTIGKTFADLLDETIFEVGELRYSRREIVERLGCANFHAASLLQAVLRRLKIKSAKDLWEMDPFSLARAKGVGATTIFVAMCILDAHGFSVEKWWGWNNNVVKFSTFRAKALRRAKKRGQEVA